MHEASQKLDFEKAAYLRDRKIAIERASAKQKVSNISENNIDVIGLYKSEIEVCIEIFFVRGSKMIGREHYFFNELKDMDNSEILAGFIKQYYLDNPNIPSKIMLREELPEKDIIEQWLSTMLGKKVELKSPKKGEKLRFVLQRAAEEHEAACIHGRPGKGGTTGPEAGKKGDRKNRMVP